jgi:hypothetical protein
MSRDKARIDALIKEIGGDKKPSVEPVSCNIVRIRPPRRRVLDAEAEATLAELQRMRAALERKL